ncbi:ureidoglycolate lyase [Roseomonas sp. BN140053]|uniref:ureidoglycolate lyase n=1 Tax=Roseomonas sp. BN140053 TaxID=3391898 RepID=UPI0039EB02E4
MSGTRHLRAERATPENTAALGTWLGSAAPVPASGSGFYGEAVALRKPGGFVTDDTLDVSVATVHRRPLRVSWLERHFLHTQTFIPLGGRPMLLVLAPPTPEAELPELDALRALVFDGSAGFALHLGTWHEFPMALVDSTDVLVLLRRDTVRDLRHKQGNEAHGPDLDKKDVVARCGVTLEVLLA